MRILILAPALLTGCSSLATPSVESALIDAGLRPALASCMAGRMTDRLTVAQLQKLRRAQGAPGETVQDLSAGELVERARRIGDPEVVSVLTTSAAACSVGLG